MFKQGKLSDELCEDEYYISDDFIVVIDGVTSKSDFLYEGKTTGKIAAEIIKKVLKDLDQKITVTDFIEAINKEISLFYEKVSFPYSKEEKGVQAACVVYSNYHREIWLIGDCQVSVDGQIYVNPKQSDNVLTDMRSLILHILELEGNQNYSLDEAQQMAREIIEPWILKSNVFANKEGTEFGYSVVNGNKIPESLIKIIPLDANAHEVIMTSDGYPRIERNLQESEEYLKKILELDKACYTLYKSTKGLKHGFKSYDDRTYIRFLVDGSEAQ